LRYRHSGGEVRQQIKWIALAGSLVGLLLSIVLGVLIVAELMRGTGGPTPLWLRGLLLVMVLSFTGVPVAIGFAVLRYRLYEIDILINRALVYVSLTATLVAVYFGGVVLLQRLFVLLTGQRATLAVVASTLLIAALFSPLRKSIQEFVDRRFYRRKYDAAKTLEGFSAKLRDETDLDELNVELVRVVSVTIQPAHAGLWLRSEVAQKGE
jgi:divalent metal cation (Fe/Co/Zn/Cd) transporter